MKRFLCMLLAAAALCAPMTHAAGDDGGKRSWRERGKNLVGAVLTAKDDDGAARFSLREGVSQVISEYKEHYKEEGRAYAREVGDLIAERIRKDTKISSTLTTVRILCWVVIVYLTLVTVFIVFALRRMRRENERILALLEARAGLHCGCGADSSASSDKTS